MIRFIVNLLIKFCEKYNRKLVITGTGPDNDIYLIRWIVFKSNFFNFYIHKFLRSDRDDFHDHPWNFWTYIVEDFYFEESFNPETKQIHNLVRSPRNYRLEYRKATDLHRVKLYEDSYIQFIVQPLTICITGPRIREWGFLKDNKTWTPWREYLGLPPDTPER